MIIYVIGTILSMWFAYLATHNKNSMDNNKINTKILCVLSALPLTLISAFRYNVGADYIPYKVYFENLLVGHINDYFEVGFYHFAKIIQIFTTNYAFFFIIMAILFSYFIFKSIYEESPNPVLSIFLLVSMQYYFISMNGMRQLIAIAIFMYSIKYIKKKKIIPFILLNIIGTLLHNAIILLFPLYFLYGKKINTKIQIIVLSMGLLLGNVLRNFFTSLIINTKYYSYIGSSYDVSNNGTITLLIEVTILVLGHIYSKKVISEEEDKKYQFFLNLQFFSTFFAAINYVFPLLYRIRWCFGLSSIIFLPLVLNRILEVDKKQYILILFMIYLLFSIYILYVVGVGNSNLVLPYTTIFNK